MEFEAAGLRYDWVTDGGATAVLSNLPTFLKCFVKHKWLSSSAFQVSCLNKSSFQKEKVIHK